jgi:chaperonin GroEL
MSKIVEHEAKARAAVLRGVDFLADAVKITEGPRGRNCILGQRALGQSPKVTRDGVTVSNYCDPSDPTEQLGSDLIREAAQKTDNAVGDGTTASIVLAQSMIHAGFGMIDKGANPMAIERGIQRAVPMVVAQLQRMAEPIDEEKVRQVATVSAHGDTAIGNVVGEAIQKAGPDGIVTAEPSSTSDTSVQTVAGLELEKSNLISPVFITHPEEMKAEYVNCRILLWEGIIATAKSLVPILTQVKMDNEPLLIIAGGYEAEALAVIINNKIKLALPVVAVRIESYGQSRSEQMEDIAALTGAKVFTESSGTRIESVKLNDAVGRARKIVVNMAKTQIIEGTGKPEAIAGLVSHLRETVATGNPSLRDRYKKRLAALTGGITIIKVGGVTVTEMEEKKDRVVDAMSAAKASVESGIVPGGGTALFRASAVLSTLKLNEEEMKGVEVVRAGCQAVIKQIACNAGVASDIILERLMASPTVGYNALTGEYEDLVATGIIDPVKVVIESLKNAAAVSCSILTMGATVAEKFTEINNGK